MNRRIIDLVDFQDAPILNIEEDIDTGYKYVSYLLSLSGVERRLCCRIDDEDVHKVQNDETLISWFKKSPVLFIVEYFLKTGKHISTITAEKHDLHKYFI